MAGTDFTHHCSEWPGNQAVFIRISILAVRLLNAQVGTFFATLSQLFIFSLPASLLKIMLGASAVSLVRTALFLQGALLALLML